MTATITIRAAVLDDLLAMTDIYNQAVLRTTATFDTDPKSVDERRAWYASHGGRHPLLVAEMDGAVVGWVSISEWSDRCAYDDTGELSIYVDEARRGARIGSQLMAAIVAAGAEAKLHTLIARVVAGNAASERLHASAGFERIGVMREVGLKFGRRLDVIMLQKMYESGNLASANYLKGKIPSKQSD